MVKSLAQIQRYKIHYQRFYPQANKKGKSVLSRHLLKLNRQIRQMQGNSIAIQ